jgi:transcriptional regulator GlxA family with amidase domain
MKIMRTFANLLLLFTVAAPATATLTPPKEGPIRVAVVMTEGATMIDFAGPWEVFQDVHLEGDTHVMPFELYTVGESKNPITTSGGMTVVPDYAFADAPVPHVVVVGAQRGAAAMPEWLRSTHAKGAVVLSVCTGAFKVAQAGLLDGLSATTHHDFYDSFAQQHPKVKLVKSARYVQASPTIFTAGGLTSGIDAALHLVDLYFGRETAQRTATYMEYESNGWKR